MLKTRSGLPKHCTYHVDRSGKRRVRFRRRGVSVYLTGIPWSEAFMRQYAAALAAEGMPIGASLRTLPGSFSALCMAYYSSPEFRGLKDSTQRVRRNILERFRVEHGHRALKDLQITHLRSIIGAKADKPAAANNLLKVLRVVLNYAVGEGMTRADSNPKPVKTELNPDLKQTVINTSSDLPPMHLCFGLRLNGPVDNTMSSCQSCHSTAQFPAISPIMPSMVKKDGRPLQPGSPEWMRFFRNVPAATPFDPQATSMDFSLQLAASIQNFLAAKNADTGGLYSVQYWNGLPIAEIRGMRGTDPEQADEIAKTRP